MVKELEDFDYERFCKEHRQEVCHGDCNQHNIIFTREGIGFMNFDYWHCGPQTEDLCLFMRKILEKHNWILSLEEEWQNSIIESDRCLWKSGNI